MNAFDHVDDLEAMTEEMIRILSPEDLLIGSPGAGRVPVHPRRGERSAARHETGFSGSARGDQLAYPGDGHGVVVS